MKIRKNERSGNTITLEIEEEYSGFEQAVNRTLVEVGKEIKIPGFRAGKAPKEIIERSINRDVVESRAAQNLIADLYPQILDEAKIEVVDFPKVEILQQEKSKPFVFKLMVEVFPEVKLGKYKGLKVDKEIVEVSEDEILKMLTNIQERFARTGPDGKKELPPLDDEFAKKVSSHKTLNELKAEARQVLERDRKAAVEASVKDKLIAAASAEAKVDIPKGMVKREVDVMLDELRTSLSQGNLTLEDYLKGIKKEEKALREELGKSAEIRVKGKVILRAVAEEEKIKINNEEMDAELQGIAKAGGKSLSDIKKSLEEGTRKYVEDYLLRRKALDFLVEKAKIKEITKPLDKLGVKEEKK